MEQKKGIVPEKHNIIGAFFPLFFFKGKKEIFQLNTPPIIVTVLHNA